MVTGAALERSFLQDVLGHCEGSCRLSRRMHSLQRFVAAPRDSNHILEVCADLIRAAVVINDGNLFVFLPGMEEILRVQSTLEKKMG